MASKTRSRSTARGKSSVIEKSLRDAQKVISSYIESGGKQVKDTLGSLVKIFDNQRLSEAMESGSRRISRMTGRGAKRRPAQSRRRAAAGTAKTSPGKRTAKPRTAAVRATPAKRTRRTRRSRS